MTRPSLFLLAAALVLGPADGAGQSGGTFDRGALIRGDVSRKEIALVFTGHEFANGGDSVHTVLKRRGIRASFFLTGDFFRTPAFRPLIDSLRRAGHYIGAHSDRHLLYCSWTARDSLLVTRDEFLSDLEANYRELERAGIRKEEAGVFLPPYEWYNDSIAAWTGEYGLTLVNFTPGTSSNADYTYPELGRPYLSSDSIYERILRKERSDPHGLNGFILLLHIGADPRRRDLFTRRLDELLAALERRGYAFVPVTRLAGR